MEQSQIRLTYKSTLLKRIRPFTMVFFLLSSFVREKSTQMVVFFYSANTGFLRIKSGRVEGVYSIFVFVWAAVQSVLKFTLSEINLQ